MGVTFRGTGGFRPGPQAELPEDASPELADIARLARRMVRRAVAAARAREAPVRRLLLDHLGAELAAAPVITGSWPAYDHVNVQAGLDAWLAADGRRHDLSGLVGLRHMMFGLADLMRTGPQSAMIGIGGVAMAALPAGPGGAVRSCVQCGLYLIDDARGKLALFLRGPDKHGPNQDVSVEICAADQALAQSAPDSPPRQSRCGSPTPI